MATAPTSAPTPTASSGHHARVLVAPVLTRGAVKRAVLIPPGRWRAWDGRVVSGPRSMEVAAPLGVLPYFEADLPAAKTRQ